ncbi:MAG: hypothetical protein U9R74_08160 [Pseudomonadota bacterium]|nr:hypothetical protein [Pseudomonadota bacterium]
MQTKNRARLTVALTTLLVPVMTTAFAATPFTLEKRVPAQSAERYGDSRSARSSAQTSDTDTTA